ncbi:TPA: hypothetical protein RQJ95_004309 [Vibrio vulnificus]|nr:hypothetical protein [Vibrio vulnificus]HDY7731397.1 hypothetical protein [Vibrio vulnificus]
MYLNVENWLESNFGNLEVKHDGDVRIIKLFNYLEKNKPTNCDIEDFFGVELRDLKGEDYCVENSCAISSIKDILRGMFIYKTQSLSRN